MRVIGLADVRNSIRSTFGAPLFVGQHLSRLPHVEQVERTVDESTWSVPESEGETHGRAQQHREEGIGPLVVRRFAITIEEPDASAPEAFRRFADAPNRAVPQHVAGFMRGHRGIRDLRVGDEFDVEMPGPWRAPVRVDRRTEQSLTLVTLRGHMEAGHIEFATVQHGDDVEFTITSWARAGDRLFHLLHVQTPVARAAQAAMWIHTCDRMAQVAGGRRRGPIRVVTETIRDSDA